MNGYGVQTHAVSQRVCATLKRLACLRFCEGCSDNDLILATLALIRPPSVHLCFSFVCSAGHNYWRHAKHLAIKATFYTCLKSCRHGEQVSTAGVASEGMKRSKAEENKCGRDPETHQTHSCH